MTRLEPLSLVQPNAALFAPRRPHAERRGVAMMLAILSVATASVLTAGYIASRESTPAIGANAAAALSSECAARSAANTAIAILETQANWAGDADPTALVTDFTIAGAKVTVLVTDLQGNPPTASTTDLLVTSTAVSGATRAVAQRVVRYQRATTPSVAIDPYLGEFALFSTGTLTIDSAATVANWSKSPAALAGKKVRLGAGFTGSASLTIDSAATVMDTSLIVNSSGTAALKAKSGDANLVAGDALPLDVPALQAALPASFALIPIASLTNRSYSGNSGSTLAAGRYQNVTISNQFVATFDAANGPLYSVNNLTLDTQGVLRIKGNVQICIRGDLTVQNLATVELGDANATVTFYLSRHVSVNDAGLGIGRTVARDTNRSATGVASYTAPDRVRFVSLNPLSGGIASGQMFAVIAKGLALGCFHMPGATVLIDSNSGLIGRVTGSDVRVKSNGALLYDPALDSNAGFTARKGPLYNADGSPIAGLVLGLTTYNVLGGAQGLGAFVQGVVDAATVLVISDDTPVATPRSGERVRAMTWPMTAFALESASGATSDTSGGIVSNELAVRLTAQQAVVASGSGKVLVAADAVAAD